jgi:glycosyltransferase involved in cell wall biosynthesis
MYPQISVITPSFNQSAFIQRTIDSVLEQNYPNIQYIVIDGKSSDGTIEILESYGKQFEWISEEDNGQSHALNKGLKMTTGEIIAFINSDDYYEPGAFLKVANYFEQNPQAYWLTGRCRTVDEQGIEIRKAITAYKNFWLNFCSYRVLQVLNYISQPATFWRREVIDLVPEFDEELSYAMDYDFWLRVGQEFDLHVIPEYLANFRIHSTSKAGASASAQFDSGLLIARRYIRQKPFEWLHRAHNSMIVGVYRLLMAANLKRD